jgi:hypothetical protein
MSEQFDPDKYLEEKQGGFDPDKYLQEKSGESQAEDSTLTRIGKSALHMAPTIGMLGGGALGTLAEPGAGTLAGAGLGGALGKSVENIGMHALGESTQHPYVDVAKAGGEAMLSELAGMGIGKSIGAVAESPVGQKVIGAVGKGAAKVGEMLSGVPEKEIVTYAKNAEEIKNMANASDNNTFEAAEQLRQKWADKVNGTRQKLNNYISETLKGSDKTVDVKPIIKSLEDYKRSINRKLEPEQVAQVDTLINRITSLAQKETKVVGEAPEQGVFDFLMSKLGLKEAPQAPTKIVKEWVDNGKISVSDAHDVKQFLQERAKSAYYPQGQVFPLGKDAARAAKQGAAVARKLVNDAEPVVAKANNQLALLHNIEDTMNANMLKIGSPESSILAAGSGGNLRNAKALDRLGQITGGDMLGDAQNLSAMRTFGSPKLMAQGTTGKTMTHLLSGTGLGAAAGYAAGGKEGAMLGAGIGAGLTSPMAMRGMIDLGKFTGKNVLGPVMQKAPGVMMFNKMDNPEFKPIQQEEMIEGFPMSKLQAINPALAPQIEKQIGSSDLSTVEKARRTNLIRKHGLIYIGQ